MTTTSKYIVNGHELEAIYRTRYPLDAEGERVVDRDGHIIASSEEFDELRCNLCYEYFEGTNDSYLTHKCEGDS